MCLTKTESVFRLNQSRKFIFHPFISFDLFNKCLKISLTIKCDGGTIHLTKFVCNEIAKVFKF